MLGVHLVPPWLPMAGDAPGHGPWSPGAGPPAPPSSGLVVYYPWAARRRSGAAGGAGGAVDRPARARPR
eukprot:8471375-Alexandrium_andersonii.AAC.1